MVALAVMDEQIIELKDLRDSNEASIEGKSKQQVGIHSVIHLEPCFSTKSVLAIG